MSQNCPLCGEPLIPGRSVNRHHLIPKSKDGEESHPIHVVCHSKIHSVLTNRELLDYYHTWGRLKDHPEISKFVKWVRKQFSRDPEFITGNVMSNKRTRRKP